MCAEFASWRDWAKFFTHRAGRPLLQVEPDEDYSQLPDSLARSLAIFQLGESGGGTIVDQVRSSKLPGIDAHYATAMRLFVKEENRHAEMLAVCVHRLGGELIRKNWTARLFVCTRRLLGLRLKVLVLLAAEVVGLCYYHLLAAKLQHCQIATMLASLVDDERAHLEFHCCFLNRQTRSPMRRALFVVAWRLTMFAAAVAVLVDHYPAMRDMRINPLTIWRRWMLYCRLAERLVIAGPESLDVLPAT